MKQIGLDVSFKYDVFISYSRHDDNRHADRLYSELKNRGIRVFLDRGEPSQDKGFRPAIEQALSESKSVAFIMSLAAESKPRTSWFQQEISLALNLHSNRERPLQIIPLRFQNLKETTFLTNFPWIDFCDNEKFTEGVQELVIRLKGGEIARSSEDQKLVLPKVLESVTDSLLVWGHTLDKFVNSREIQIAIMQCLDKGASITLILLNPMCPYSIAQDPFHRLESRTSSINEINSALEQLRHAWELWQRPEELTVLLTNYMPRFRTIIVDDSTIYLNLYLYGSDVAPTSDFRLKKINGNKKNIQFVAVSNSVNQLLNSVDVVPYIQFGMIDEAWHKRHIVNSHSWSSERRSRYQAVRDFYRNNAIDFDDRFGSRLETYVMSYLDNVASATKLLSAPILVVGCGSGKELEYLRRKQCEVYGVDFALEAVKIAQTREGVDTDQVVVSDFFDLRLLGKSFSGVIANASFVHLPERSDMEVLLSDIFYILEPGGRAFIRVLQKTDKKDEWDSNLLIGDRWFLYFELEEMVSLAEEAGFYICETAVERHESYPDIVSWPCLIIEKPS